ncbi:epithelial membrane protein 1 [Betta splendens]|uniref:Epithelial membrane protein 1 n=1 Tax=Betta splendens TaxID=158456 RepID=A0A6P7N2N2_BETSP|nr:epithelial membrane protein 1 [Betta splendens]XP_029013537.1 epithelial membrane protein 1 [Betta splendens]
MLMLAGIVVVHIATIIMLLVATMDSAWWVTETESTDLWYRWKFSDSAWHYTNVDNYQDAVEYFQTVQATSVLACIFAILALCVFVAQLFTLPKGHRFAFTGFLQLIACLCIMTAASIYTNTLHTNDSNGWYGHSYILAWVSFVLSLILTITYLVLRKKNE